MSTGRTSRASASRRAQNMAATRAALLAVARRHFAQRGYSAAEIGRISAEAGVTTGAVYHHFAGKKGLFQAVAEDLEAEILAIAAAAQGDDPWHRLRAGFDRLIDICAAPEMQRILFIEAPQVIGPEAWHEIELRYAFGALRALLTALIAAGRLKPYPVDLIARSLLALLREAAGELARSHREPVARAAVAAFVAGVLDTLEAR
jgi:AcrR family transcriptional regulator